MCVDQFNAVFPRPTEPHHLLLDQLWCHLHSPSSYHDDHDDEDDGGDGGDDDDEAPELFLHPPQPQAVASPSDKPAF